MAAYYGLKIADKPFADTVSFQPRLTVSLESEVMYRTIKERSL